MSLTICKDSSETFALELKRQLRICNEERSNHLIKHDISDESFGFYAFSAAIQSTLIGGIYGELLNSHSWVHIKYLWVTEAFRNKGIATELMQNFNNYSINQGCKTSLVETWNFQARPFYEKNGFVVVGEIPDCPPGTVSYSMVKHL